MLVNDKKSSWNEDNFIGPYLVEKRLENDNYLIYRSDKDEWKKYNVSKMKEVGELRQERSALTIAREKNVEIEKEKAERRDEILERERSGDAREGRQENLAVPQRSLEQLSQTPKKSPMKQSSQSREEKKEERRLRPGDRIWVRWPGKINPETRTEKWPGRVEKEVTGRDRREGSHEILYDDSADRIPVFEPLLFRDRRGVMAEWGYEGSDLSSDRLAPVNGNNTNG
jgi:hypothetical protein